MARNYYKPSMFLTWPGVELTEFAKARAQGADEKQFRRISEPLAPVVVFEMRHHNDVVETIKYDCEKLRWSIPGPHRQVHGNCKPKTIVTRIELGVVDGETLTLERKHNKKPLLTNHIAAIEEHLRKNAVYVPTGPSHYFEPADEGVACPAKLLADSIFLGIVNCVTIPSTAHGIYYKKMHCLEDDREPETFPHWKVISVFDGTKHLANLAWNVPYNRIVIDSTFATAKPLDSWPGIVELFDRHIEALA